MHAMAAKAVAFGEALQPGFQDYAKQVAANAKALGEALLGLGYELVTGGTDTHLLTVDLRPKGLSGKEAEARCLELGLVINKNLIPKDPRPAMETSGLRLGTPALTTRGFKESEIREVAELLDRAISGKDSEQVRRRVLELAEAHPLP